MIRKITNPYIEIVSYSALAFLLFPIPLLFLASLIGGLSVDEYSLPLDVKNYVQLLFLGLLWLTIGLSGYVWRCRKAHEKVAAVRILKNMSAVILTALVVFQFAPLPFVSSTSLGLAKDESGVYQWSYSHYTHWEFFGGAKMTSAAAQYIAQTPKSKSPEFAKQYRYAGDHYIIGSWLAALLLGVAAIKFGKIVYRQLKKNQT